VRCIFPLLLLVVSSGLAAADERVAAFEKELRGISFDQAACYRVRDLKISREDIRVYLTDGFLIFAQPVNGRRIAAFFTADVEGGDAELLLLPPDAAERKSLATFTQSPTLNEHFKNAMLLFTDDTGAELLASIKEAGSRQSDEMATLLSGKYGSMLRSFTSSFEIRLVEDVFGNRKPGDGFLFVGTGGSRLGNFDAIHDPAAREQINAGQLAYRNGQPFFDTWTSFPSRSVRNNPQPERKPEVRIETTAIEAQVDADLMLRAKSRLSVSVSVPNLAMLEFEISRRMQITKVLLDGQPVEFMQRESMRENLIRGREDETFLVLPPAPLAPGTMHEIEFQHEGKVIGTAGNGVYYVNSRGIWYPHHGMQFGQYDITFRFPKDLKVVATGEVVGERVDGEYRVVRRKTSTPIRMAAFNFGDYASATATRGNLKVEVYGNRRVEQALTPPPAPLPVDPMPQLGRSGRRQPDMPMMRMEQPAPPNPAARLADFAKEIAGAFEFLASFLGPPPLTTLAVSPIPAPMGQGFPGMLYLSTIAYLDPAQRPADVRGKSNEMFFSELLHSHEAAHQWWGNRVAAAGPQDEWLMEALANYSALLYMEQHVGAKAFDSALDQYRAHLLEKDRDGKTVESAGPINQGVRLVSSLSPSAWRVITYEKGSWIMHMLRRRLGDKAFLEMLGECVKRYGGASISTAQFRSLAAEFLPKGSPDAKLETFFEAWVYGTGIPSLKMTWSAQGKAGPQVITGTITQTGAPEEFETFVPVVVQFAKAPPETHWVKTSSDPVTFTIKTKAPATKVLLDPQLSVLLDKR